MARGIDMLMIMKTRLLRCSVLPDSLVGREYYKPTEQGAEVRFKERLNSIKEWKKSHK